MAKNLRETSQEYEPKKTLNIADLDTVSLDAPMDKVSGVNQDGKNYEYYVAEIEDEKYRVPVSVIEAIKTIMETKPKIENVRVIKKGSGMNTEYTVIPLD